VRDAGGELAATAEGAGIMSIQVGKTHETASGRDVRVWTGVRSRSGPPGPSGRYLALLVLLALGFAFASPQAAGQGNGGKSFTALSQNAYLGADISRVMLVDPEDPNPYALVEAVTTTYYEMLASQPAVRMSGLADRIAARMPDIVALQEMYVLRKQSPGDLVIGGSDPAEEVVVDFLWSLMDSLAARGLHYKVAAMTTELDVEMPMFNADFTGFDDARLTDRDVILVRTDLPPGQLRVSNSQGGHFDARLTLNNGLDVLRGWCSVDVFIRGERFRFLNTHLQDESAPEIQFAQARELMAAYGPADTGLPVIMAGDFNADPDGQNGTFSYPILIGGGFDDAWTELHPSDPGLTWGHDSGLADKNWGFVWRIDLVLFKGRTFVPKEIATVDTGLGRPAAPFWPSDHAGVWATFELR
jgi:endonuclease/exonuclease/phosphatase family metal-dependent hydrolase